MLTLNREVHLFMTQNWFLIKVYLIAWGNCYRDTRRAVHCMNHTSPTELPGNEAAGRHFLFPQLGEGSCFLALELSRCCRMAFAGLSELLLLSVLGRLLP